MQSSNKKILLIILILLSVIVFCVKNDALFLFINQKLANGVLDFIVVYIFIPLFLLMGIIPFLMLVLKKDKIGFFSLFSGVFCYIAGNLIKLLFKMPRPYTIFADTRIIGPWHVSQYSFPSTTTMLAFGLALPFLMERKGRWSWFFLTLAFLVGFTVIYTGFHFPRDVVFGIFLSLLFVCLLKRIKNKFINEENLSS
jgi:undecaprenyl-diphosphatase